MNHREIEFRIQDLLDGKLEPEARSALLARIERDPQLLELYWDYAVLDSAFARLSRSASSLRTEEPILSKSALRMRSKRQLRWSLLATAAILVLTGVLLRLILVPDPAPTVTFRSSPGSVLDVTHAMAGDEAPPLKTLTAGSRALLEQGTVELTFENGVRSIVRGPADFTLHTDGNLFLQSGTAWFHVPEKAVGFKVKTPKMIVTDLGTAFGVRSLEKHPHEVHVFEGKVEVETRGHISATEILKAGAARAVGPIGHLREIPLEPTQFLTTLPESPPHLHWSFDEGPDFEASKGGHPAADHEVSRIEGLENEQAFGRGPGRFGGALVAKGAAVQAQSGWPGVDGDAPRTIAHWIRLTPGGPETQVIVGWGSHALTPFNPNPAFLTYLRSRNAGTVAGVSFGSYCLDGTTPLDDGQWHHFAVVYTGAQLSDGTPELTCYLDGRPEKMSPGFRTDILSPDERGAYSIRTDPSSPEAINLTLFPTNWDTRRSSHMPLAIDELYVFEAALSQSQVLSIYQKNTIQ